MTPTDHGLLINLDFTHLRTDIWFRALRHGADKIIAEVDGTWTFIRYQGECIILRADGYSTLKELVSNLNLSDL